LEGNLYRGTTIVPHYFKFCQFGHENISYLSPRFDIIYCVNEFQSNPTLSSSSLRWDLATQEICPKKKKKKEENGNRIAPNKAASSTVESLPILARRSHNATLKSLDAADSFKRHH
jgi:hypothetical protein